MKKDFLALNKITNFSKLLALLLFVIIPILTFWIGYNVAMQSISNEKQQEINNISVNSITITPTISPSVSTDNQIAPEVPMLYVKSTEVHIDVIRNTSSRIQFNIPKGWLLDYGHGYGNRANITGFKDEKSFDAYFDCVYIKGACDPNLDISVLVYTNGQNLPLIDFIKNNHLIETNSLQSKIYGQLNVLESKEVGPEGNFKNYFFEGGNKVYNFFCGADEIETCDDVIKSVVLK